MSEPTPSGLVAEGLRLGVDGNDLLKEFDQVQAPGSAALVLHQIGPFRSIL